MQSGRPAAAAGAAVGPVRSAVYYLVVEHDEWRTGARCAAGISKFSSLQATAVDGGLMAA